MITTTDSPHEMLERDVGSGSDAGDVEQQPAGDDDLALAGDVGVERRAQRELHVGRGEQELALRPELDAAEHEHGGAGRDPSRDEAEPVDEGVSRDGDLQACPHHCF